MTQSHEAVPLEITTAEQPAIVAAPTLKLKVPVAAEMTVAVRCTVPPAVIEFSAVAIVGLAEVLKPTPTVMRAVLDIPALSVTLTRIT